MKTLIKKKTTISDKDNLILLCDKKSRLSDFIFSKQELKQYAKNERLEMENLLKTAKAGKLPVPNFSAGGIATPADAALMMYLGAEALFVGSGIFKSDDPEKRAKAIVDATTYYDDPEKLVDISMNLKSAMKGLEISEIPKEELLQNRGW